MLNMKYSWIYTAFHLNPVFFFCPYFFPSPGKLWLWTNGGVPLLTLGAVSSTHWLGHEEETSLPLRVNHIAQQVDYAAQLQNPIYYVLPKLTISCTEQVQENSEILNLTEGLYDDLFMLEVRRRSAEQVTKFQRGYVELLQVVNLPNLSATPDTTTITLSLSFSNATLLSCPHRWPCRQGNFCDSGNLCRGLGGAVDTELPPCGRCSGMSISTEGCLEVQRR